MKKSLSVLTVFLLTGSAIFFACKKNQNEGDGNAPTYKDEATSTGGNPNVTTTGSTAGTSTSGTSTGGSTTGGSTTGGSTTGGSTTGGTTTGGCGYSFSTVNVSSGLCSVNCSSGSPWGITSADMSGGSACYIEFGVNCPSVPAAGTYAVVTQGSANATQCSLTLTQGTNLWYSTGGGTVTVSIVGGKHQFTFSNIPIQDSGGVNSTASGTITEP